MCQYIESLRVVDGHICNLAYHQQRMNKTRLEVFGQSTPLLLNDVFKGIKAPSGLVKLRFIYDTNAKKYTPYVLLQPTTLITDTRVWIGPPLINSKKSKASVTKY